MKYKHTLIVGLILGLAVVAFGSHPYISDPGTLLEGFENVNDWSISGTGATAVNDANISKQGNQSIKLNAVNGVWTRLRKTVNWDFSNRDVFSLWFYVVDKTTFFESYFTFYITSTTDYSKYFYYYIYVRTNGWNYAVFTKSDFTNVGGDSWDNTMVRMQLAVEPIAGENVSINFDDLRFGIVGQPKVIITLDDVVKSQIDKAYPIMAANGQAGVAFVPTNWVGDGARRLTLADLQTLKNAGWDISNHTAAHKKLTEVSQEEMEADIDGGYDWLVANGFGNTAKFFAYPYNAFNDAVIAKLKQRHILARGASGASRYHFDIVNFEDLQYQLNTFEVMNTVSVATAQTQIDKVIEKGGVLILLFHDIVDENADASYKYLTADFQDISDYLKTKQDAGELEVITFSDYYNALIELNPFCLEEPAMDFNGDCRVDFADFALFTQSWLECNLDPQSACWE